MKLSLSTGLAAGLLALAAAPALAAPVTVDLRIEGADAHALRRAGHDRRARRSSPTTAPHACGAAPSRAARSSPPPRRPRAFAMHGDWNDQFGSPTFTTIAGENVDYDPATGRFLGEYKNGAFADGRRVSTTPSRPATRCCSRTADGSEPLLALSGPATAKPGETVTAQGHRRRPAPRSRARASSAARARRTARVIAGPWQRPRRSRPEGDQGRRDPLQPRPRVRHRRRRRRLRDHRAPSPPGRASAPARRSPRPTRPRRRRR